MLAVFIVAWLPCRSMYDLSLEAVSSEDFTRLSTGVNLWKNFHESVGALALATAHFGS